MIYINNQYFAWKIPEQSKLLTGRGKILHISFSINYILNDKNQSKLLFYLQEFKLKVSEIKDSQNKS